MDAIEFLKKLKRMCDKNRDSCHGSCYVCEIFVKKAEKAISCSSFIKEYPEEAIAIVEKWSAEHPAKTRQSEFLKIFLDAKMDESGEVVNLCPRSINMNYVDDYRCEKLNCLRCRERFWLAEVE